jgi:ubiquinone/menaquinone biosynthesis C-methylase UbiE
MRLFTIEDFRDIYIKISQRGFTYILSKLKVGGTQRTLSSFNQLNIQSSNWWIIPLVQQRWNKLITGSEFTTYEELITKKFFSNHKTIRLLSIGSGICSHETKLAELNPHWEVTCLDFSHHLLNKASENAEQKGIKNIYFANKNIYKYDLPENHYDIVLFHASLHHFKDIEKFLSHKVIPTLKTDGKLIINEYVGPNRLQFPREQIKEINKSLLLIDRRYRKIYKTNLFKDRFYGSGLVRMIITDPSECIDSENIIPAIHKHFDKVFEKHYGGNILMSALKEISHHFVDENEEKNETLRRLFEFEDNYLANNTSDFVFGIYQKKEF